jgi:hypothetical protein
MSYGIHLPVLDPLRLSRPLGHLPAPLIGPERLLPAQLRRQLAAATSAEQALLLRNHDPSAAAAVWPPTRRERPRPVRALAAAVDPRGGFNALVAATAAGGAARRLIGAGAADGRRRSSRDALCGTAVVGGRISSAERPASFGGWGHGSRSRGSLAVFKQRFPRLRLKHAIRAGIKYIRDAHYRNRPDIFVFTIH